MEKITINDYKSAFIAEEFVIKSGSWIIDLKDVQFMTYRLNEKDETSYLVAFHIGDKETKIMVDDISAVKELFTAWTNAKGLELEFERNDIKGEVKEWD
tara:strand:+ start:1330 stop:1626 length:297 start_codon:yes stop_codon:yes gene_type:complete